MTNNMILQEIARAVKVLWPAHVTSFTPSLARPADLAHGDFSCTAALQLAKKVGEAPRVVAEKIVAEIQKGAAKDFQEQVVRMEIAGPGFINFFLQQATATKNIFAWAEDMKAIHNDVQTVVAGTHTAQTFTGKRIMVEHTSVNPNKSMHVGHLRNAVLGDAIVQLIRKTVPGARVQVANFVNDAGAEVADIVLAEEYANEKGELTDTRNEEGLTERTKLVEQMGEEYAHRAWDLYVAINKKYKEHPELLDIRAEIIKQIEEKTTPVDNFRQYIVRHILGNHLETMARIGIHYDVILPESVFLRTDIWQKTVEKLETLKTFERPTTGPNAGAWVLSDLGLDNEAGMQHPEKIIRRSNGTATYVGKDIALHLWKFGLIASPKFEELEYAGDEKGNVAIMSPTGTDKPELGHAEAVINLVDVRQTYPQEVVKQALLKLGFTRESEHFHHVAYEVVALSPATAKKLQVEVPADAKVIPMSGRKGIAVKAEEFFTVIADGLAKHWTKPGAEVRSEDKDITHTSHVLQAATLRYFLLKFSLNTMIVFDADEASGMEGDTGPYLLYVYARIQALLEKNKTKHGTMKTGTDNAVHAFTDPHEQELIKVLNRFPEMVATTIDHLAPNLLCGYLRDLTQAFNSFYGACPIVAAPDDTTRLARLALSQATANVLKTGLDYLGIPVVDKM